MHFPKFGATALAAIFLATAAASLPAVAQPTAVQLPKQMVNPMNEARAAIIAKDFATAKAKLDAAQGFAKTPQDNLAVDQLRLSLAAQAGDSAATVVVIEKLLASGLLSPEDIKRYKAALPEAYLKAGDKAKSFTASRDFLDSYGGTPEQFASLGNQAAQANDHATAIIYAEKAIAGSKAAGSKPIESHYRLLLRSLQQTNQMDKYYPVAEELLAQYPKEDYWKPLIARAQQAPKFGFATRLDMFRTLAAAGVKLSVAEKGTMASEAVKRGLPNEALQALTAAEATSDADKKTLKTATDAAAGDKAAIDKEEKDTVAKGTGPALAKLGEAFLSYGDNAKAIDLIQKGLTKGIPDAAEADIAKLHLGIAQYRSGDKAAAKTTWGGIKETGDGAGILAHNWVLIADIVK